MPKDTENKTQEGLLVAWQQRQQNYAKSDSFKRQNTSLHRVNSYKIGILYPLYGGPDRVVAFISKANRAASLSVCVYS